MSEITVLKIAGAFTVYVEAADCNTTTETDEITAPAKKKKKKKKSHYKLRREHIILKYNIGPLTIGYYIQDHLRIQCRINSKCQVTEITTGKIRIPYDGIITSNGKHNSGIR
jgi:hypothetical protein